MIDRTLSAWYQKVLSANEGTPDHGNVHGFTVTERIPTFVSVREWKVEEADHPSIFIRLAPLTVPAKGGSREIIFQFVGERIFSEHLTFCFQKPQDRSWNPSDRPALYSMIVSLRSWQNDFWGEPESRFDRSNRDIYIVSPDRLYDGLTANGAEESMLSGLGDKSLIRVIDHTLRKVFVGVEDAVLLPIEWEGGRMDVNVRLFYNLSFPSSIDKARNNVLGSHIWFWGFYR